MINTIKKHWKSATIVGLSIVIIFLCVVINKTLWKLKSKDIKKTCNSRGCIRTASDLILSMNPTVDPCENFYEFTCGNFAEIHPIHSNMESNSWYYEKVLRAYREVEKYLQANETNTNSTAVLKAKTMYNGCTKIGAKSHEKDFQAIADYFKELKMNTIPKMISGNGTDNNDLDWIDIIAKVNRDNGLHIFVEATLERNNNDSVIYINLGYPTLSRFVDVAFKYDVKQKTRKVSKNGKTNKTEVENDQVWQEEEEKVLAKHEMMSKFLTFYNPELNEDDAFELVSNISQQIEEFEKTLFIYNYNDSGVDTPSLFSEESLELFEQNELQSFLDGNSSQPNENSLIVSKYLKKLYENIFPSNFSIENEKLIVYPGDLVYLKYFNGRILPSLSKDFIELYIWWTILNDFLIVQSEEDESVLNAYCITTVSRRMGFAVTYGISNEKFYTETLPEVKELYGNIQDAYEMKIRNSDWLDVQSRDLLVDKLRSIKAYFGSPEGLNSSVLDKYYSELEINEDSYVANNVNYSKWMMMRDWKLLKEENNENEFDAFMGSDPTDVNAFYSMEKNTITVLLSMLQNPFYEIGLRTYNYAITGATIGHELTHAFDSSGRLHNKDGEKRDWLSEETQNLFMNRSKCFQDEFDEFYDPDIGEHVNGTRTLDENIADDGGTRVAYMAFKNLKPEVRQTLPGLEEYSEDQLFFIAFGNSFCNTRNRLGIIHSFDDDHAPFGFRVNGNLKNMPEFAEAFKCKLGSEMNPTNDKCSFW